ncbi:KAT7 [Cordylochernes scorpioides]|uniref:KAT7 n=1 Tax=Cordylochernes scorpioides TaxID=51811 RepID=A0ABY6LBF3_9ARAC|nr:KAT7 [Cordylochernes scorpioides]
MPRPDFLRPINWEVLNHLQRSQELQRRIFGSDLHDFDIALTSSAKSRIYRFFMTLEIIREDPLIAWILHLWEIFLNGEPLSPLLFILFITDLIEIYNNSDLSSVNLPEFGDIHLLLYADDIAIIGESRMNLQKKIKILKEYLDENLMTLNESKSKIMVPESAQIYSRLHNQIRNRSYLIECNSFKLTLKYWLRVLNMSSDRLPRICFNRTRELSNASGTPIGFIKKLTNLLNNNGSPALVSCDDPETLRSAITGLLKTAADQSIQNDLTRMDKSKLYSHYKDIHISFMTEGYLLGDFPFPVVRLLAQVRILSSFFRENHTKMLCGENPICAFCNSKLKNEITHYIFYCSALKEERRTLMLKTGQLCASLPSIIDNMTQNEYIATAFYGFHKSISQKKSKSSPSPVNSRQLRISPTITRFNATSSLLPSSHLRKSTKVRIILSKSGDICGEEKTWRLASGRVDDPARRCQESPKSERPTKLYSPGCTCTVWSGRFHKSDTHGAKDPSDREVEGNEIAEDTLGRIPVLSPRIIAELSQNTNRIGYIRPCRH